VNLYSLFVYIEHNGDESPKECLVSYFHQRGKSLDMPVDVGLLWNVVTVPGKTIQAHCGRLTEISISLFCRTEIGNSDSERRFLVQYPSHYTIHGHHTGMEIKYSVHYIQHRVQNLIQPEYKK
jgi:hypothetical protein